MNKKAEDIPAGLEEQLSRIDSRIQNGLERVLRENPDMLRDFLIANGYFPADEGHTNEEATPLPKSQQMLEQCVSDMGVPRSAEEMVSYIAENYPELVEAYSSAQHRTWLSTQLNELAKAGRIGRFREGRTVKYTDSPDSAVKFWAMQQDFSVTEVGRRDAEAIAEDTGMPESTVLEAIDSISA